MATAKLRGGRRSNSTWFTRQLGAPDQPPLKYSFQCFGATGGIPHRCEGTMLLSRCIAYAR